MSSSWLAEHELAVAVSVALNTPQHCVATQEVTRTSHSCCASPSASQQRLYASATLPTPSVFHSQRAMGVLSVACTACSTSRFMSAVCIGSVALRLVAHTAHSVGSPGSAGTNRRITSEAAWARAVHTSARWILMAGAKGGGSVWACVWDFSWQRVREEKGGAPEGACHVPGAGVEADAAMFTGTESE
ncbi:hypothetical protein DFH11DRAFT_1546528 [Phellopilus nigrolimitatus]|nr:hypothetical protein DFH11DRAFT_1546528 [Phellopilus nigrolimitatus]